MYADPDRREGQRLVAFHNSDAKKSKNPVGVDLMPLAQASQFALEAPAVIGVVYVTHPLEAHQLIPFADYDEKLARDKLNEALRVFTALGASRIVATSKRQDITRLQGRLGSRATGIKIGGDKESTWNLTFDQRGTGGEPTDPRPLRFADEPGLDAVCEGVLRLGVQRGRIEITRTSQFGLDGELAARLRKANFRLGFEGKKAVTTRFLIEAAFSPDASKELDTMAALASPEVAAPKSLSGWLGRKSR